MANNVFAEFGPQLANPFAEYGPKLEQAPAPPPKPEKTGTLRAAADIPVQVGRGVAVGIKALSDVFGADNPVSRAASGVEDFLGGLLSAQAKNDQAEIARIMKEAEDKGVGDQVAAAVKAFATAPVDMLSQALGTAVPVIAGGLAGSVARLGAAGVGAISAGIGAGMGAGTVKGQIYDAVKQELLANKVPEAEAEKRAQEAQAYGGKNLDQILMGAGIGAAEAAFGAERILTGLFRKGAVKPSTLPAKYRIPTAAATEAVPEMAQAAQEQVAQNIALQREGYDVPTMRGVVGQAALEGIAGMGLGAITGAVQRTEAAKPEAEPPKPQATAEPQQAEAEAPKPVTGEAGIVRPEEETPISREVAEAAEPEVAQPATAEIQPIAEEAAVEFPPAEPVAPPAAEPIKPVGAAGMGQRMVNAANRFRDSAVEQFGLTPEQADRAMGRLMKEKVLSLDPVTGQFKLKDGRFWDRDVLLRAAGETVSETAPAQAAPIEAKRGAATRIIAGENKIPAQWEVVEADSVKAAMTEGKTQPRDRKRAVSNAQIMSIAQNPDFDRLSDTSQTMDYGAPTLTQDGAIVGGNGRFEGVNLSYDTEAGQRYKQSLVENAERLGLDPEQVGAMQKPILVRRITQPADTRKLAIQSNIVAGLELSDMEQAALDAERMAGLDRLEISEAGDIPITSRNMDVLRSAFKDYTTEEMGKMMSAEGGLSQAGLRRVRNAILYKAYGKTDTLARLVESPDPDLKNVGTALMRASGDMSKMMDAIRSGAIPAEYDIIEDLTGAIETLSSLRASGTKVQEFLAQSELFGDGISGPARAILRFMDNNLRSAKSITEFLNDYAQAVLSAESATGGLFGEAQLPTKQETLERAAQKYEAQRAAAKAQRTLEEQPAGEVRPEARVQPEGEGRTAVSDEETGVAASEVVPQEEIARPEVMPPKKEIDRQALEEKRQTILDMIETKKERREPIPEGWIEKLTEISAQLRGEKVDREEIYSMEVAGHPMFDGPTVLRNLIPIKVKNAEAAQRALDRALELERQVATEFYGARYALQSAKNAAAKKAAQARIKKLTDQGWDDDALKTLREETIEELSRLVDAAKKTAPKAGEVRAEARVQPEGEGRAAVSDEEAAKVSEQQAKDAGTPANVTEAMDEYAFGKQMGAKQVTEMKQKGEKASITMELRQKPNKELATSVAEGDVYGVINQLVASQNPLIAQIGKLASQRPYFGIGLKSMFPGMPWPSGAAGAYSPQNGIAAVLKKYADREHVVAHEIVHYLTYDAINNPTEDQKPAIQRLQKLFSHVKQNIGADGQKLYGLTNLYEFVAEANSNVNFQYKLRQIKYQNQTAWGAFTKFVAQLLGLGNDTALTEIIALTEELASPESRTTVAPPGVVLAMKPDEETYRGEIGREKPPTPTAAGQQALNTINQLGMGVKEPEKGTLEKAKAKLQQIGEAPAKDTIKDWKKKAADWMSYVDGKLFSADAPFENKLREGYRRDMKDMKEFIGAQLAISQSQAVNADAVSTRSMLIGKPRYRKDLLKWEAVEDPANEIAKAKILDKIAEKYGLTKEEAVQVAHTYLAAANYESILKRNAANKNKADRLREAGKDEEADKAKAAIVFVTPEQAAMVQPGLEIANQIPEVKEITALWNQQRENIKNVLVETGLWTPEYADAMMDNAAYVPFYREMEEDSDDSPEIMIRGLQVKAKEHKLKGSSKPVANVFENMARWQQYAINRAIRNHKALQMVDAATEMPFGDGMMATKVSEAKRGKNITRVWRDGKQEFYEMADPLFVDAFKSLGAVSIPSVKYFTAIANKLRQFIVLYPMFSVAQLSQDSVAAMFSSGLQPKFALKIPYLAVKHAISTYRGTNNLHNELINFGVVGVRDFNAAVSRDDAAITAGIKMPPGGVQKVKYVLERIAMSADNAVRQAVYEAAMQQPGVTQAEALEKAFEVINFRRRGSSKLVNLIGQTVPFFYAYLSAQRVAYKTITGVGISPVERKAAIETLIYTSAAVMALSFMYAMANGDDEAYEKTPGNIRDRSINIPGTNGFRIPLRPDFFLFPKIIAEHTYHLIAENGFSDPAKFKKAMADNFFNATLSPNVVPQAFKPAVEIGLNYDFFSGKPIVGFFEQNKEAGRQFNDSTSEFAKMMGGAGLSPQKVDHFIRGYFGTVGGLFLYGTNFFIEGESGVPRPELSFEDAIKTFPGVSALKQKPTENALKVDFYELRDAIEKAKNTYDDIKKRSPEGLQDFIENEENYAKLALEKSVTKIANHLSDIRRTIQQVSAAPEDRFSAAEKQERIKELKEVELQLLKSVNLKEMRAMAKM